MNERIGPSPTLLSRVAFGAAERIGFWGAVLLPVTYLPVLYGFDDQTKLPTLAALLVLNVLCLLVGRRHLD